MSYGEKPSYTPGSTTLTKTWEVPFYKSTGEGNAKTGLSGAVFKLRSNKQDTSKAATKDEAGDTIMLVEKRILTVNPIVQLSIDLRFTQLMQVVIKHMNQVL